VSASNAFENSLLELILNNDDIAGVARGLAVAGSLYLSLHTADPGEAGDQTTSEVAYTSYARHAMARDGTKWTVTGSQAVNTAQETWPTATGGGASAAYWGIGTDSSGAGVLLFSGAMNAVLAISNGITPTAAIGALIVNCD
jgi:hypothetical protein